MKVWIDIILQTGTICIHLKKNYLMKSFKIILLLLVSVAFVTHPSFAQTPKSDTQQNGLQTAPQTKEDPNHDFDAQMAKLHESIGKLQAKSAKATDPKMKADIDAMIAKMSQIDNEYNSMKSNTSLSKEQIQQSQKHMRSEMQEAHKMHEDMKAKYGEGKGSQGGQRQGKKQQNQEEAPEPK
jgi:hypothetical protein